MERAEERLLEMFIDVASAKHLTAEEKRSLFEELVRVTLQTGRVQAASLFLKKEIQ